MLTPSRFDKYLMGDKTALTAEEVAGYELLRRINALLAIRG
mgnify:CR=1 FL=1